MFPVSARLALRAKRGEPALWDASHFAPLEAYIQTTLDEKGRLRLKFMNPLGVAEHLVQKYLGVTSTRLDLLSADFAMLEDVDAQLKLYREDMGRDFSYRMSEMENILFGMEQRGQDYFDETLRIGRVFDLLNKARIQQEFEHKVVADVPQRIEASVNDLIDWLVESDLRQWQAVMEHVADRRRQHQERIVGDAAGGSFHFDRERLIDGVGREAQQVVDTYDKTEEAELIAYNAQTTVAALAAVEVGAVGLGTLVTILATTAAADATGIVLASAVAILGLFVIPARRRQAKTDMRTRIAALREQLIGSLRTQFEKEMQRSVQEINAAIAPYTRFVRAEQNKLSEVKASFEQTKTGLERLRVQADEQLGKEG